MNESSAALQISLFVLVVGGPALVAAFATWLTTDDLRERAEKRAFKLGWIAGADYERTRSLTEDGSPK